MYCKSCGAEVSNTTSFCGKCGSRLNNEDNEAQLLNTLSQRLNTNGIIWLVIGILQILGGLFVNWFLLIVGVLNIISSIQDMQYSKTLLNTPSGIIAKFEPLTGPIITLIYNLLIGGVIGVIGSVYYFFAIRSYVMENKQHFARYDAGNETV